MFSLRVKSLLNKTRGLYTILQTPSTCCYHRKLVDNNNNSTSCTNLRRNMSPVSPPTAFLVSFRGLSTEMPKEKVNTIRNRPKRRNVLNRRPVPFKTADFIYTSNGIMSDSSVDDVKRTEKTSTSNKKTFSEIRLQNTTPSWHTLPEIADFKAISLSILLQYLKDKSSSSTRIPQNQILKLEDAFVYKLKELTIHEMFSVARYFFLLQHRAPKYLTTLFEYIDNNFEEVVSVEGNPLLHIMFYIYFHGSCPESLLQKMEHHLSAHLDELSLNDIGLACLGYFRANRRIRSFELLDRIADKTIEHFPTIEPHHLIHTLKSFRHSGYSKISYFEKLADHLVANKTLGDMSLNQVMHVIMAFASTRIYHSELIRECMKRSVELVQSSSSTPSSWVRTKELGRIVWAAGTLGVDDQDLSKVKMLIDAHTQIEKTGDGTRTVMKYPESISDTVMGSVFLKIFPRELISLLLEEKTVNILQGLRGLEKRMQMLFIHHTINIECPNYSGPKLKQFMLDQFGLKDRERAIQFELDTRPGLLTLFEGLKSILGENNVHCHMILPHFTTADIEIHLDAENRPVFFEPETISMDSTDSWKTQQQVTSDLLQMLKNPSQKQPSNSSTPQISRRIAVQVTGRNQCALNQSERLLGNYRTKLRQLSAMGYEALLLMPVDLENLKEEVCPEKRKEWVLQNVIKKLNVNCDSQNL